MYKVISAETLSPHFPADLPALLLYERPAAAATVTVLAVGDIGFSGRIRQADSHHTVLQAVQPYLQSGDIVFGNLESPLVNEEGLFAALPDAAAALRNAGFTLINLANNHIYDYGPGGLSSSAESLEQQGIDVLGVSVAANHGIQQPKIYQIEDVSIGWLSFGRTLQPQTEGSLKYWEYAVDCIKQSVTNAQKTCDNLIVSIHAGLMLLDHPDPTFRELAHEIRALGATLVLFHHAHVLQGIEVNSQGQIICHCLGNFLWDYQEGFMPALFNLKAQQEGAVYLFEFDHKGICKAAILPTYLDEALHVNWAVAECGDQIVKRLCKLSQALMQGNTIPYWTQRIGFNLSFTTRLFGFHLRNRNWPMLIQLNKNLLKGIRRLVSGSKG